MHHDTAEHKNYFSDCNLDHFLICGHFLDQAIFLYFNHKYFLQYFIIQHILTKSWIIFTHCTNDKSNQLMAKCINFRECICQQLVTEKWFRVCLLSPAGEHCDEALSEPGIHEAICDRISTAREECQQMEERYDVISQLFVDQLRPIEGHCVDRIDRCPADEELQHHYEQHLNYPLLSPFANFGAQ